MNKLEKKTLLEFTGDVVITINDRVYSGKNYITTNGRTWIANRLLANTLTPITSMILLSDITSFIATTPDPTLASLINSGYVKAVYTASLSRSISGLAGASVKISNLNLLNYGTQVYYIGLLAGVTHPADVSEAGMNSFVQNGDETVIAYFKTSDASIPYLQRLSFQSVSVDYTLNVTIPLT